MATNNEIDKILDNTYIEGLRKNLALAKEELSVDAQLKDLENKIQEEEKRIREEKKKSNRWSNEIKIFFMIRDYLNTINACAITPQYKLKIVALAYRKTKQYFEINIYTANKWQSYFVNGIRNIIAEHWIAEIGEDKRINFNQKEIVLDRLYITSFLIESEHLEDSELQFFYN